MNSLDIKKIRENLGYTQQELADRLEVNIRTVQKWESGASKVRKGTAFMIRQLRPKDVSKLDEDAAIYNTEDIFLEKEGVRVYLPELVDHFVKNKEAYLEQSEYLQLYLNKHIELGVKARLEELGYTVKLVKKN